MEILGAILIASFIALLLVTAVTFGFALMTVFFIVAVATACLVLVREAWRRWRFVHSSHHEPPKVIEGEYEDISHQ